MALTTCPDCGKQVSDKAPTCPNCGCPIATTRKSNRVMIALPSTNVLSGGGLASAFIKRDASVSASGRTLWTGHHGETAIFDVTGPTKVTVELGSMANPTVGNAEPGRKYQLVQDLGFHWKAVFRLTEVDVIDSGM